MKNVDVTAMPPEYPGLEGKRDDLQLVEALELRQLLLELRDAYDLPCGPSLSSKKKE